MELEYSDKNSKRSKLYIAVGVIIALIVGGVVFVALRFSERDRHGTGRDAQRRRGCPRHRQSQAHRGWRRGHAHRAGRPDQRAGIHPDRRRSGPDQRRRRIATGQLLTRNLLASNTSGQPFSILDPGAKYDPTGPNLRAVSVTVPDDRAVAGTLQEGQRVDLIVTMALNPELGQPAGQAAQTQAKFVPGPSTKVTLQSMVILARNGSIYILRADLDTAEKIAELQAAGGQFTMALRPDQDDRVAKTNGSTIDSLINEFRFPYPEAAQPGRASPPPERPARRVPRRATNAGPGAGVVVVLACEQCLVRRAHLPARFVERGRSVDHHIRRGDLHLLR